ncbi:SdrD B-like domain-containing protein [Frigoribacterium salinisoli]
MHLAPPSDRRHLRWRPLLATTAALALVAGAAPSAAVASPEPASLDAPPRPTASADLVLGIASSEDGHGPFTHDSEPGGDGSGRNGRVRTADAVTWSVSVSPRASSAEDAVLTLRAAENTVFDRLPEQCAAGSELRATELTCQLGDLDNGVTVLPVVTRVPQEAHDGSSVRIEGDLTAAGVEGVSAASDSLTVTAAPRWDLAATTAVPLFERATEPGGDRSGFQITYPVLLHGNSLDPAQGTLGLEALAGEVTFVDDVSKMYGSQASPAVLAPRGAEARPCGVNVDEFPGLPAGRGGGDRAVVDSGTITCTQAAPGEPVTVRLTGVDSTLSSVPTASASGGPVTGGVKPYAVSAWISLWVPEPPVGDSFTARNVYRDLVAPSVTGQENYPGGTEPLGNNRVDRNIGAFDGVVASQRYWGVEQGTTTTFVASGKYDEPYVTPGQDALVRATLRNTGTEAWSGTTVCTVLDRDVQSIRRTGRTWATSSAPKVTGAPLFAPLGSDDPADLRDATCDDDHTWYADPEKVPGGASAVGKVRWTYDHPGDQQLGFTTLVGVHDDLADHTRLRSFTSVQRTPSAAWVHDTASADEANGGLSDFLTVTADLARVTTKIVDPGTDADSTRDETQYAQAGDEVELAVYPTVTNAKGGGLSDTLVVHDLIPEGSEYVRGSASPGEPEVDEVTVDGRPRQRLTWRFIDVHPNDPLAPVTFRVQLGAAVGPGTSQAEVVWDRDVSESPRKRATRGLHVLAGAGFTVRQDVDAPLHVVRDDVTFTLRYQDLAPSALPSSSLVTVLPHDGDDRGTETGGRVVLASAVDPADPSETVRYTRAPADEVPADPADDGPRWCPEAEFGAAGCPAALSDVTAVRIDRANPVASGQVVLHDLVVRVDGGQPDARLGSDFTFRAESVATAVTSRTARTAFASGAVGGRAWLDEDSDGLRGDDEAALPGTEVALSGTDDRGDAVTATTTTDEEGRYGFDALRPGDYRLDFGRAEHGWTTRHVGDDPTIDSDVDEDGVAPVTLLRLDAEDGTLAGVTRALTVDAGALPADAGNGVGPVDPPVAPPATPGDGEGEGEGDPEVVAPTEPGDSGNGGAPVVDPPAAPGDGDGDGDGDGEGDGDGDGDGDVVTGPLPDDRPGTGTAGGTGAATTAAAEASPHRQLAFTGAAVTLGAALAALLAVGLGGLAVLRRRREG